jgi:hypothetical protein
MKSIFYNIPVSEMKTFRNENLMVRADNPAEISELISKEIPKNVLYIQLIVTEEDITPLMRLKVPVPLDLVIHDLDKDLPLLYNYAPLTAKCPVRVSVPVATGFSRVAKLAVSLNFAVKLEVLQPEQHLIAEMSHVLNDYLHLSAISQPIEFFHSLFLAFYHKEPLTLWDIQEENPAYFRFVTDDGKETLPGRFSGQDTPWGFPSFMTDFKNELLTEKRECCACEFFETCWGYFKWPQREYPCNGIKDLFRTLKQAAEELKKDLSLSAEKKNLHEFP